MLAAEVAAVLTRGGQRSGAEIGAAFEALLEGRYVEYLERRGDRIPAWTWTNLLAHGTEEAIRRVATTRPRPFGVVNVWRRARVYLASEVLDAAELAGSLARVQREVLVPLELDLVAWSPTKWSCAGEWATRVLTALDDHRRLDGRRPAGGRAR